MKIVLIGNGVSSERVLSELFKREDVEATLIKGEEYGPYPRPRLSEYVKGRIDSSVFKQDKLSSFISKGLSVMKSIAERIDGKSKCVILDDGRAVPYDSLIIATGARANRLALPNSGLPVYSLRTLEDAEKIISSLEGVSHPVVIGAGLLGLELASAIKERTGKRVAVVEGASQLLPKQLDERGASFFESLLKKKGLDIVKGSYPKEYSTSAVVLEDGRSLDADIVFESVGIRANKEIAETSGIECDRAIVIDEKAMTSLEDVYAVGDASSYKGFSPGLVYYALETARVAALNACGGSETLRFNPPSASIEASGIPAYSLGDIRNAASVESKETKERYEALYVDENGILAGAVAVGSRANMMKAQRGIGKPLDMSLLDF